MSNTLFKLYGHKELDEKWDMLEESLNLLIEDSDENTRQKLQDRLDKIKTKREEALRTRIVR
ncbi:hypothetical protein L0663_25840 [Dyadobacter sp. CY107]|uniref:hypothetical protein n=1 Tax=Dyadobacter fanqingshengii TaxID=2906443 RepID=UPI001F2A6581|nr:hypothetical protein [Dyadobacter fanqingshengii]MCF2506838.1 hypothetical protein [Dyadobacter fanqingshengii]